MPAKCSKYPPPDVDANTDKTIYQELDNGWSHIYNLSKRHDLYLTAFRDGKESLPSNTVSFVPLLINENSNIAGMLPAGDTVTTSSDLSFNWTGEEDAHQYLLVVFSAEDVTQLACVVDSNGTTWNSVDENSYIYIPKEELWPGDFVWNVWAIDEYNCGYCAGASWFTVRASD